ncbi:MAG: 2-isopropylmalate synthase [Calditrichales bacterium]|nr:2-isopropylmalate synthase [Calditrichales bacterium]
MQNKIIMFDTTLRDGEQSPGASLNVYEKLEIARQLEKLNVDIIEAGFPVSSPSQFEGVKRIAGEVNAIIASLARAKEIDIKAAYDSMKDAPKKRVHIFTGVSDQHILGKFNHKKYGLSLNEKRKVILKMSCDAIQYARTLFDDVEFSPEDAGRTDINYLIETVEAVIEAGVTTINIPDTTGYTLPKEFGAKIAQLRKRVKNLNGVILSVHCHNDLGLAVANSISAVENGAQQVECTINGIGERAGNASLEEFVMALNIRKDLFNQYTNINTKELYKTSRMVSTLTGITVQPNKAIVGDNAFAHEAGIHQDGMLKNRNTYEIMRPETVGAAQTKIVLGRHSGKHGLKARLDKLGYTLTTEELNAVYCRFTELADKKKEVLDDDLRILMQEEVYKEKDHYNLDYFQVNLGNKSIPTATVRIKSKDDTFLQESSIGDGPVDAVFNAIDRTLNCKFRVESYQVRSVTSGREALGEVMVRIKNTKNSFNGRGVSTDIIEASANAYLQAINLYELHKFKQEN